MWKNIPWERRAEIAEQIEAMPPSRNREILRLAFIENMSTADIARYAESSGKLLSRRGLPISKRRVLQIIAEEIPDYNAYQKKKPKNPRSDHGKWQWNHEKTQCAICGRTERLEWHHMIPAFLGGTAEQHNMICLCKQCHGAVTDYQRQLYPDAFISESARKK